MNTTTAGEAMTITDNNGPANAALANATLFVFIATTMYVYTHNGNTSVSVGRSQLSMSHFDTRTDAEDHIMKMYETLSGGPMEGVVTTYTIQEYAPIPF
jgi:hypothetical protein